MRLLAFCTAAADGPDQAAIERIHRAVLESFLPLLQRMGEVAVVTDPAQLAPLQAESLARGDRCLLLCFGAPQAVPDDVACGIATIFDWGADLSFDLTRLERWRAALASQRAVLALSQHAAAAIRCAMGESFPTRSIGVPVFDRWRTDTERRRPLRSARTVAVTGTILDSRDYRITVDDFRRHTPVERYCTRTWSGGREELRFDRTSEATAYLGGFYDPEDWGTWSRIENPWIMLPFALSGSVKLTFCMAGYGRNAGRSIGVEVGGVRRDLVLWDRFDEECLAFELQEPAHVIQFLGLDTDEIPDAADHRCMGLGLRRIAVEGSPAASPSAGPAAVQEQVVDGVVYTVLDADPEDLQSPLRDFIKAFCFAFRRASDATLVLHLRHPAPAFFGQLQALLQRIGPVPCRIIVLHGQLTPPQLRQLIDASTYYVHAPRCRWLSIPLLQFMSAGVPPLVPSHVSEASGVMEDAGFVFRSILESPFWPTETRKGFLSGYHYPDWGSLVASFKASHRVATKRSAAYARMSRAARDLQAASNSDAVVGRELEELLQRIASET